MKEALKLALEALEDPISFAKEKAAIAAIKEALAQPEQEIEYCTVYHCAGDCGQPHNQKEMQEFLVVKPEQVWVEGYGENSSGFVKAQPEQEPLPNLYVKDINGNFHPYKEKGHTENCAAFGDDCSENHLPTSRVGVGENDYTAQPEQEPVGEAYLCDRCHTPFERHGNCPSCGHNVATKEPVYTTPPQPKEPEQEPVAVVNGEYANCIEWKCTSKSFPAYGTKLYTTSPQRKPLTHEQRFDLLTKFEPHKNKWEAHAILIDMVEAAHGIKE